MSSNHLIMASNKQAAFHVYADLCEVQNWIQVKACELKNSNLIYFEGKRNKNEDPIEIILPVDEDKSNFSIDQFENIIEEIKSSKKIKLGIVSNDYSTVYYDFTLGIDSPFEKKNYLKNKINQ